MYEETEVNPGLAVRRPEQSIQSTSSHTPYIHTTPDHTTHTMSPTIPPPPQPPRIRLAILHQTLAPPAINGVTKPPKPGGYRDSGADIGFVLSRDPEIEVLTPVPCPRPENQGDWTWPEDEDGLGDVLGLVSCSLRCVR